MKTFTFDMMANNSVKHPLAEQCNSTQCLRFPRCPRREKTLGLTRSSKNLCACQCRPFCKSSINHHDRLCTNHQRNLKKNCLCTYDAQSSRHSRPDKMFSFSCNSACSSSHNCVRGFKSHTCSYGLFLTLCLLSVLHPVISDQQSPPHFVVQPTFSGGIVSAGQSKILQCQAVGFPTPEVKWLKDGIPLGDFTNDPLLRLTRLTTENSGAYQCIARNAAGAIFSEKTMLTVAYIIPPTSSENTSMTVTQGHAAILIPPQVDSVPTATAYWQKEGLGRLSQRKFFTTANKVFVILATEPLDSGLYRVTFTNTQIGQEVLGAFVNVTVQDGDLKEIDNPSIVIPPRNTTFNQDAFPAVLECVVNARPLEDLQISWWKDGLDVAVSGISFFLSPWNQTLTLLNVGQSHVGMYQCRAWLKNKPDQIVTANATVTVHVPPMVKGLAGSDTVSEMGSDVLLNCEAIGVPVPTVTWFRNAVPVGNDPDDRYATLGNGSLRIQELTAADSGIFQCVAENSAGVASARSWLHVKSGMKAKPFLEPDSNKSPSVPVFLEPPDHQTVLDGKDAQIPCVVSGAPKPTVTWILNGTVPVHSAGRVQILESGTLLVASVEPKDAGNYTCIRTNNAGTISGSALLTVLVRTQIVQPPVDTKVILSSTAELQCKVSHDPSVPVNISWFFENVRQVGQHSGGRFQILPDGTLKVAQARNTDVGLYYCKVLSPGGNETRYARLDVIELPHPPTNVKAEMLDTTPKSVNISWTKGFDGNSPITMYIVQMQLVPSSVVGGHVDPIVPWLTARTNISGDSRFTVLNNLKPSSSYQFRVSAINGVGEGNPSSPTQTVVLPPEPPSGPPRGVVGGARSATSIMLQWQPPPEEERNGDLLGYVIRYKLAGYSGTPWAFENITNEAHHNYLLQDLIVWQNYQIEVAAYNRMGLGVYSDSIYVRTREGVPQSAPSTVKASALNSTAVKIWWKPPDPQLINGINQGYKVQAWSGSPGDSSSPYLTVMVPPSPVDPLATQNTILSGLGKYSWYNLTVLCFTSPGDGPRSDPIEIITDQDVPDKVGSLKFEDILDTSVRVIWTPPDNCNGILQGYTLKYHMKDSPQASIVKNFSVDTTQLIADSLRPTTAYTFEIYAWTSVGSGPSRMATIQSGIPPVLPGAPTKLAVSNIGALSVVLQFTPGFDGNSSIIRWTVEAHTRRNETWFKLYDVSDPEATTIQVLNLVPFTEYCLRLYATNVVGSSPPSEPSKFFQTIQDPPSHAPYNVTVRAVSANVIRVRWTPLQQFEWYGIPRGYNISYRPIPENQSDSELSLFKSTIMEDHNSNSFVLDGLEEYTEYEVYVQAFNDVGSSPPSALARERTREAAPSMGPADVQANATSSTTIVVKWGEVAPEHQNGIIEGFKVYYGAKTVPFRHKVIEGNRTSIVTLIELKKYTLYSIQVLAYTRVGDGALSLPPVYVQTFQDVPGMPSNISFPDVSMTTARIIWDVPSEPNGEILNYRVSYRLNLTTDGSITKELPPTDRTLKAFNLIPENYYVFTVTARTEEGWGQPASAVVFATNKRELPQAPSAPRVSRSQVQAHQMTFSWTPGRDGFAPLRYYTVQMAEDDRSWKGLPSKVDPTLNTYTVTGLKPFTSYRFRIQATNDIGPSGWSQESNATRTLPAAPSGRPDKVTVTPFTTTSVKVEWQPLSDEHWNGDTQHPGYRVEYCQVSTHATVLPQSGGDCSSERALGVNASTTSLQHLEPDRIYQIKIYAFNGQGDGPPSVPVSVYVGEAVPTGSPRSVKAEALSSTEIRLTWEPPMENQRNGDLLGYKIFYLSERRSTVEEMEAVPVRTTSYVIMDLLKFCDYKIQILAFNPAGDGPRSQPQFVRTLEDAPGPPGDLTFSDVTMTSLNVSWSVPRNANGKIRHYRIAYETAQPDTEFSKQVKQKVTQTHLLVHGLRELVTYRFTVWAETISLGPFITSNITTGPQEGSPGSPQDLQLHSTSTSVMLIWRDGPSGAGPVTGYLIEARDSEEDVEWQNVVLLNNGPQQSYTISYQNLLPSKNYQFRLFSRNRYGISFPAIASQPLATPSKTFLEYKQKLPFYREVWFLVMLAAATVVVVILVVAVLCVKSKAYKYKHEAQKTIHDDRVSMDDGGFATFELRQSRRGTLCKNTLSRKNGQAVFAKPPPRPSPASVTYSDEEDAKGYDDNCDSSSLTEKPSEISSTDSQATDSDRESDTKSEPHSFVNHYANVNDTFRQSWKRQRPVKPPSYTDSEPEGSVAVSLNGGHIIMNNMAGSRAPLPGFSSFV